MTERNGNRAICLGIGASVGLEPYFDCRSLKQDFIYPANPPRLQVASFDLLARRLMHVGGQLVKRVWRYGCAHATITGLHLLSLTRVPCLPIMHIVPMWGTHFSWLVLHVYWIGRGKLTRNTFMRAWVLCKVSDPPGSFTAFRRYFLR